MLFELISFAFPTHNRPIGAILTKRGDIMQHPPPRGRRSFWQWYHAQTRFARIGLGCASIFVALLLCTVALTVYGSTLPPTRAPTHAVILTTPRPTATQAPRPTATPTTTPTRT